MAVGIAMIACVRPGRFRPHHPTTIARCRGKLSRPSSSNRRVGAAEMSRKRGRSLEGPPGAGP